MYHEITDWNHVISVSQNYRLEPYDQCIVKFTSKYTLKDHNKRTIAELAESIDSPKNQSSKI